MSRLQVGGAAAGGASACRRQDPRKLAAELGRHKTVARRRSQHAKSTAPKSLRPRLGTAYAHFVLRRDVRTSCGARADSVPQQLYSFKQSVLYTPGQSHPHARKSRGAISPAAGKGCALLIA